MTVFNIKDLHSKRLKWVERIKRPTRTNGWPDELHAKASDYASNRHDTYIAKMKKGEVKKHSKEILKWIWVAHYEGDKEGYWTAKGDDRFTTDPDKLFNEKKHWVGLTDEELREFDVDFIEAKLMIAKLKERNT